MTVKYKDYRIYIKDENFTLVRVKINDGKHRFSKSENVGKELEVVLGYFTSMEGAAKKIIKDLIERDESTVDLKGYFQHVGDIKLELKADGLL